VVKLKVYYISHSLPEMPELTGPGINADMKKILISQHSSDRDAHLREKVQNHKERVMIISEILTLLSEPIKLAVEAKFPNYINAPDVIAVIDCIKSTYHENFQFFLFFLTALFNLIYTSSLFPIQFNSILTPLYALS